MILDIDSVGFDMTDALKAHIFNRLRHALGENFYGASRVVVRVLDINGPRGGIDMECRIVVNLPGMAPIVASDRGEDLYFAIARAATIAGRAASRSQGRRAPARTRISSALARLTGDASG